MAPCFLAAASGTLNNMKTSLVINAQNAPLTALMLAGLVAGLAIISLLIFGIISAAKKNRSAQQGNGPMPYRQTFKNGLRQWFSDFKGAWKDYLYLTVKMLMAWPTGLFLFVTAWVAFFSLFIIAALIESNVPGFAPIVGLISIPLGAFVLSWLVLAARPIAAVYRAFDRYMLKSEIATPEPSVQARHFRNSLAARLNGNAEWREPVRGFWRSFTSRITDVTAWRSMLYLLLSTLLSALGWLLSTLSLLFGLAALTYPLYWTYTGAGFPTIPAPDGGFYSQRIPGSFSLGCTNIAPPQ